MPAGPRSQVFDPSEVGIYHCYNRCVRRAWLCGSDPVSGKNFDHRKDWIQQRLQLLAANFAVDLCGFAVLDNHFHTVLRNRPDIVEAWSDHEVVRRWWQLCPTRRDPQGNAAADPKPIELGRWLDDPKMILELRRRLSDISWFMRLLCQKVGRDANREDGVTGKFWEARFKCQRLLDDAAVLACSAYVDLNVIRAGQASTPEESKYTSAYERIIAWYRAQSGQVADATDSSDSTPLPVAAAEGDLWLCPVELASRDLPGSPNSKSDCVPGDSAGSLPSGPSRRASDKGFLPMTLEKYLELLDWTGRQIRPDKRGAIASSAPPILERLGIKGSGWTELVTDFPRRFRRVAGRTEEMAAFAGRRGRRWVQGIRHAAQFFG